MTSYLAQRLAGTVPVLLLISLLVFLLIHAAPGDPTLMLLGEETNAAEVARAKERWGLDQPLYVQYLKFLKSAASGDFGRSFKYTEPVIRVIMTRLPATIELAFFAIIIATLLAIPLGVWAGSKPNSWIDNLGTTFGLFGISMPSFWLAIMLILFLAGVLNILPTAGRSTYGIAGPEQTGFYILDSILQQNWRAVWDGLTHIFLPALALGVNMLGILMRVTRSSILEVMTEDYVQTARAKGLRENKIVWRHVARNALIPGHYGRRPRARHAAQRLDHRRDRFRLAGQRQPAHHGAQRARLSARHWRGDDVHSRFCVHQPDYRRTLCSH